MEASLTEEDFSMDEEEKETEESDEVLSISDLTVSEDSDEDDPRSLEGGRSGQLDFAREHGLVKEEQPSYEPGTSGVRTKPKSFLLPDPEDIQSSEEDVSQRSLERTVAKIRPVASRKMKHPLDVETEDCDFYDYPCANPAELYHCATSDIAISSPRISIGELRTGQTKRRKASKFSEHITKMKKVKCDGEGGWRPSFADSDEESPVARNRYRSKCTLSLGTEMKEEAAIESEAAERNIWDETERSRGYSEECSSRQADEFFNVSPSASQSGVDMSAQDTLGFQRESSALPQDTAVERRDPVGRPELIVTVEVKDKTLLIPLQTSDWGKSISWLAGEVAERYCSLYQQRPVLTLSTNGYILCPVDPISAVVANHDHLKATVTLWENPPLEERYINACQFMDLTNVNRQACERLHDCVTSGHLSLCDFVLSQQQLLPVYRALRGQRTLTNLNLAGNCLGDTNLVPLAELLQDMPNLRSLNLETNHLSSESLHTLSKAFKSGQHSLEQLNLSHNCLGDLAAKWLANMLRNLTCLTDLSVADCALSARVFTPSFCYALRGRSLKRLIIADNLIEDEGIALLLPNLYADSLLVLDLSHTMSEHTSELAEQLQAFVASVKKCSLKKLNLSGCHLGPLCDMLFLNRLVAQLSSLQKLNISDNSLLTMWSLEQLLYMSTGTGLEKLVARDCSVYAPFKEGFLPTLKDKLESVHPLRKFVFTCFELGRAEVESLRCLWTSVWGPEAKVEVEESSVSLSVV